MPYSKSQSQRQQRVGSRGGFSVSNISIKYRLPLLIGTLLFVVIVACSWASYRSVKTSAMEVGREHLRPAVAAVRNEQGAVIGYLVRWRRFAATADNRQQMTRLLGTSATLYFPRVTESAAEYKRATATIHVPKGSETILLVEDADWVRKLARQVLEGAGYRVLEASSADAAIRMSEASHNGTRIDLLLTDVVMPGMSGNDMSKRVLVKRPNLPVLYMSGYTDDAIVQHGVLEPGINFIQKPFSPDALALKVREVLDARPQPVHHR